MFDIFGAKEQQKALQRADEYVKDGRVDSAIKVLEENLTEGEESFELYMQLSRLYFATEERTKTVKALRQAKSISPRRIDEVIAVVTELYFQHASIDLGEYCLQLYIEQQRYDEINKILKQLSERDVALLVTKYEKLKQSIDGKNIFAEKDFESMFVLSSLLFFNNDSNKGCEALDAMIGLDVYNTRLLSWARIISREHYNDHHASLLVLKIQIAGKDFTGALNQAQRTAEKFAESTDALIGIISAARPPQNLEAAYAKLLTDLHIKKGDLNASINQLLDLLEKDVTKADDVIKGLRELERLSPDNIRILYALGDTYMKANRLALAIGEYEKILAIDKTHYEQIVEKYNEAFRRESNNPTVIGAMVNAHLGHDDRHAAVEVIEKAYRADPGFVDEYIVNLNTILDKNLDHARALYLLGLCYATKGNHEHARIVFENLIDRKEYRYVFDATEEVLKVHPEEAQYVTLKARSLLMLGKENQAFSVIKTFIESHPDKTTAVLPTLDIMLSSFPALAEDILLIYERHRKEDPFIVDLTMARAHAFMGEYRKSVTLFERLFADEKTRDTVKRALIEVIRERPQAVPLLLAAARIFMREGQVEIATQFFKTAQTVDSKAFFEIVDEFYDALKTFPKDREVRTLLVNTFFDRKIWDRVIEECKRAVEVFGREAQYFNLKLGAALVEKGSLSEAVRPLMISLDGAEDYSASVLGYLDKILDIDKSNVPAHFARGRALGKAGRINEAVEEYLLTVRILPARAEYVCDELKTLSTKAMANPLVLFAMGSVEYTLKRYDNAVKHMLQACDLDLNLVKRVIPLLETLIAANPSPLLAFSLARVYHLAGLRSSALKCFIQAQADDKQYREPVISEMKKICAEDPQDSESRKALAQVYFNFNNFEDCLDLIREVYAVHKEESDWAKGFVSNILQKNPKHVPSYYFLAHVFIQEKTYAKAIETYNKLVEVSPAEVTKVVSILESFDVAYGDLLLYLGNLYKNIGDVKKALAVFDRLFSQDTSYADALLAQIDDILTKAVHSVDAYLLANKIYAFKKNYEKALDAFRHARELMPDNEDIIVQEGQLYYAMGDAEKAIKLYAELLERSKDRTSVYRLINKTREQYLSEKINALHGDDEGHKVERARIYLLMDDLSRAEKELQFIPQTDYGMRQQTLLKARCYLKRNRPMDALEIMKDLPADKETAPIYADIYEALGSYEAAALVLRKVGIEGLEQRIAQYEKLAQERRLLQGRYFIEGRR